MTCLHNESTYIYAKKICIPRQKQNIDYIQSYNNSVKNFRSEVYIQNGSFSMFRSFNLEFPSIYCQIKTPTCIGWRVKREERGTGNDTTLVSPMCNNSALHKGTEFRHPENTVMMNDTSSGVTKTNIVKAFLNRLLYNWYPWKANNEAYKPIYEL